MSLNLPSRIQQNIDQFTGRAWLLPKVLDWYEGSQERILLLTGGPGTGKSMIMAWLAEHGPEPKDATAREQLAQIRTEVKATHFCIAASGETAPRALAQNLAQQLTGNVPGFAEALKASLDELVRIEGVAEAGTAMPGAALTGVQIGTLNLAGLGEELSFNRTLREPLKTLYENGHDQPMLLLVDALDEALTYTGVIDIVRLLAKLDDLPEQVRFLVSARPDPRVLKHFREAKRVDLIEDAPPDMDDVQAYAWGRLAKAEGVPGRSVGAFADRIAKAADGIFLYAAIVLDELLPRLPSLADLDLDRYPLPDGLSGLYYDFLNRELGRDEDRWYESFKPLLGLIAVSQGEGLTRTQLAAISDKEVEQPLRICKQYLAGELPEGPFGVFHKSFADFLLEDDQNVDYRIDGAGMHRQITDHYWQAYYPNWPGCDAYGLRYLPVHLSEAGEQERLRALLLDFGWLQAKLEATAVKALVADYDLLPGDAGERLVGEALRLSAHVLAGDKAQLWSQLYGRLIGEESSAIQEMLAEWPDEPWLRSLRPSLTAPGEGLLGTLAGHTSGVSAVTVYDSGRRAISASWDGTLKVWDLEPKIWDLGNGQVLRTLEGHTATVNAVAVYDGGRLAISASKDHTLKVWNLESGQELSTLEGHSASVEAVAVCESGGQAISASWDHTLKVWDLENGQVLHTLKGHSEAVLAVALYGGGRQAISASKDHTLKTWNLQTGRELRTLEGHSEAVWAVATYDGGRRAISASGDKTLKIWDLEGGKALRTLKGHDWSVYSVAVYDGGRRAISGSLDCTLKVWDLEGGKMLRTLRAHPDSVYSVAVYNGGRRAISASGDNTLKLWDLEGGQKLHTEESHTEWVTVVAAYDGGRRAISGSLDHTLKIWDLKSGQVLHTLVGHKHDVLSVAVYDGGRRAISASRDDTLKVWDLESGEKLRTLAGHTFWVNAVAVYDGGRRAISASQDKTLKVWDLESGQELQTLEGHTGQVRAVVVYNGGQRAISASNDHTLKVWDLSKAGLKCGQALRTLKGHTDSVGAVVVYDRGRRAISASNDTTLKVWDLEGDQEPCTLAGHARHVISGTNLDIGVNAVAVYDDGRQAISASQDKTLKVWDLERCQEVHTLEGHTGWVNEVAVYDHGQRAISASSDNTLRIWDLESGVSLAKFSGDSGFTICRVAPDDRTVVAGDAAGEVHILRLENAQ